MLIIIISAYFKVFFLSGIFSPDGYKSLDVDCLISENRYLRESVEQIKEEKDLANEMGRRYKKALEKTNKPSTKEVDIEAENAEIRQLITQTSFPCPPDLDLNSHSSLRELAVSLLETLNERMLQLKHQVKFNFKKLNCVFPPNKDLIPNMY